MSAAGEPLELRDVRGPSALGGGRKRALELLLLIAVTDFKRTYLGTALGYVWSFARPLLLFGVLLVVFTQAFDLGDRVTQYPVLLLFNIVLFTFFQESTGQSVLSLDGWVKTVTAGYVVLVDVSAPRSIAEDDLHTRRLRRSPTRLAVFRHRCVLRSDCSEDVSVGLCHLVCGGDPLVGAIRRKGTADAALVRHVRGDRGFPEILATSAGNTQCLPSMRTEERYANRGGDADPQRRYAH